MVAPTNAHDDSGVVAVGTVLADRYRIDRVLGTGGMGRVYRAEHVAIGKPVAVKVLHASLGKNQEAAIRFQREALASGRLDHPNIVGVIDFGTLETGALYLVMEALEGEHLGQRIEREKRIPWTESLAIMRGVLLGLRHAHDRGVVHRDIKPDNIFLANKDGEGVVKILDFGIAKLYVGLTDDQQATRAGITVGTPKYLSPEQAVGGAIGPACDVYSASVVLYEMLAGRAPFDSDDPLTLLTAHAGCDVPAFQEVAPDLELPDGLEELVRHGLAKFPAERIGSALEYVQRVDEILRTHGVDVPTAPGPLRASQSIGIPLGPHANPGSLTPSLSFLATPMPFEAPPTTTPRTPTPVPRNPTPVPRAATPAPRSPDAEAAPAPQARPTKRRWIAIGAVALVAGLGGAAFLATRGHGSEPAHVDPPAPPASTTAPHATATTAPAAPVHPAPHAATPHAATPSHATPAAAPADARLAPAPAPHPRASDHEAQLAAQLHALQAGATCAERKKAVAKLAALGDPKAVPALRKARARGKVNACLLPSADKAIKALAAK